MCERLTGVNGASRCVYFRKKTLKCVNRVHVLKLPSPLIVAFSAENLESVAEDSSCSDDDDVPEENRLSEYSAPDSDPDPDTNGTPKKKKGGDVAVSSPTTSSVPSAVVSNKNMSFEEKRSPVADADQSSVKKETCTWSCSHTSFPSPTIRTLQQLKCCCFLAFNWINSSFASFWYLRSFPEIKKSKLWTIFAQN